MKSKKVTMLAVALVVAVVAAAGIGYAVNYTGSTSNENNAVDVMYVTLSQTGDARYNLAASFIGKEYCNTVTDIDGTTYIATGITSVQIWNQSPVTAYVISNDDLTLVLADSETAANTYSLKITTSEDLGAGVNKISYYFGIGSTAATATWSEVGSYANSVTTWTISDVAEGSYTVYVAAAGTSSTAPTEFKDVTFDFEASAAMTA